jgi:cell division protein FtsW
MIIEGKESFKRWIKVPGLGQFQPSELAKLGLIMFCAWGMSEKSKSIRFRHEWMDAIPYIVVTGIFCVLVMLENHLSGTILVFCIGLCMIFLGCSIKIKYYLIAGGILVFVAAIMIMERDFLPSYIQDRLSSWLDPDSGADSSRWQINQSLYAIGSGGLFGVGLGKLKTEASVFARTAERFYFCGCMRGAWLFQGADDNHSIHPSCLEGLCYSYESQGQIRKPFGDGNYFQNRAADCS